MHVQICAKKIVISRALRLGWASWPSAAARTDLGNCTFGKLPLGKNPLVKYLPSNEQTL